MPSSSACSAFKPAVPSASTKNDSALSNHRFALSPCSSWSQAAWTSAGTTSSRHTQNSAVSTSSSAAALPGLHGEQLLPTRRPVLPGQRREVRDGLARGRGAAGEDGPRRARPGCGGCRPGRPRPGGSTNRGAARGRGTPARPAERGSTDDVPSGPQDARRRVHEPGLLHRQRPDLLQHRRNPLGQQVRVMGEGRVDQARRPFDPANRDSSNRKTKLAFSAMRSRRPR